MSRWTVPSLRHAQSVVAVWLSGCRKLAATVLLGSVLASCAIPSRTVEHETPPVAVKPSATTLGRATAEQAGNHPGESAFLLLDTGREALHQRIALADTAESSIDAQYYIWNDDTAGRLLAERLLRAADRGVRVRLLLDDVGSGGKDEALALLDAHSKIEVRVYNPFRAGFRDGIRKWLLALLEFDRINRRMHNKAYIVDQSAAIVGGRNIGDEYFDRDPELNFRDRDLLALGPVVGAVSASFAAYWDSEWAYPVGQLIDHRASDEELATARGHLRVSTTDAANLWSEVPQQRIAVGDWLEQHNAKLLWAKAEMVADPPGRKPDPTDTEVPNQVVHRLVELVGTAEREILIESAYFNLGDPGLERLEQMVQRGVSVRVLTNSMASTDLLPVHAGYSDKRPRLLEDGVELHEFRPDAASCRRLVEDVDLCGEDSTFSLHAKTIVFDRQVVYVGSFNVTPRSVFLNSEAALIVHSPQLAARIAQDIEESMGLDNSWRVRINGQGSLEWVGRAGDREQLQTTEPETTLWQRMKSGVLSKLPLDTYY